MRRALMEPATLRDEAAGGGEGGEAKARSK
jgi:hypothetical protein